MSKGYVLLAIEAVLTFFALWGLVNVGGISWRISSVVCIGCLMYALFDLSRD